MQYQFKFKKQTDTAWKIPTEGHHTTLIVGVTELFEAQTLKGEKYTAFRYILETNEYDEKRRLTLLSKTMRLDSFHPKSNLFAIATAALGKNLEEASLHSPADLFNKFVDVVISHNTADQRTYANLDSVFPCKTPPSGWVSTFEDKNNKGAWLTSAGDEEVEVVPSAE